MSPIKTRIRYTRGRGFYKVWTWHGPMTTILIGPYLTMEAAYGAAR